MLCFVLTGRSSSGSVGLSPGKSRTRVGESEKYLMSIILKVNGGSFTVITIVSVALNGNAALESLSTSSGSVPSGVSTSKMVNLSSSSSLGKMASIPNGQTSAERNNYPLIIYHYI